MSKNKTYGFPQRGVTTLYNLKPGERFYNYEGLVLEMIHCDYDPNNPDQIGYTAKAFKRKDSITITANGKNVANQYYYRYTGRDYSSFNAGFRAAMRLMIKHMGKFDIENAGMENPVMRHLTMGQEYNKWKINAGDLW